MRKISELENNSILIKNLEGKLEGVKDFSKLAIDENDEKSMQDCVTEIKDIISELESHEFKLKFNGEADEKSCYIEIHAGAGGTESQDWAQMLLRMYSRWSERKNFNFKIMHETFGEEAGIKSFDSIGNNFDPDLHEALMSEKSDKEDNIILKEFEKGYKYDDKILRHAKVVVSKN